MANEPYEIRHRDSHNLSRITYWVCATDANKPDAGLTPGDLAWVTDTGVFYIATSTTQWARQSRQIYAATTGGGILGSMGESSIIGTGAGSLTLPADFFQVATVLKVQAGGYFYIPTAARTCRLRLKKGSAVIWDSTATTIPNIGGGVLQPWYLDLLITGQTTTTVTQAGSWQIRMTPNPYFTAVTYNAVDTISASSEAIDLTAEFGGGAGVSDIILCRTFVLTMN